MAVVPVHRASKLSVDYDRDSDVLYVAIGEPRPAEGEEGSRGVVYRYAVDDNTACGVTIVGFRRNGWGEDAPKLAELIANQLHAEAGPIEKMICRSTAATTKSR